MASYLPDEAYQGILKAVNDGTPVDRKVADQTATAMKEWAIFEGGYPLYSLVPTFDGDNR